ncbi:MAG: LemA family protein [Sphaerochaetaceae bacterium]|nr:LemA family protein [Sphaerochaetaceae bacterium]
MVKKKKHEEYFRQLQQRLQHDASQIDNYMEQRVVILTNLASLLDKAVNLDKDTFSAIAKYRGGVSDAARNEAAGAIEGVQKNINVALENYPDLKAHAEIADAIQQNSYLQREITAAREVYNDTVNKWNHDVHIWPLYQLVAFEQGYTTRIPFSTSKEMKDKARSNLFA